MITKSQQIINLNEEKCGIELKASSNFYILDNKVTKNTKSY